MKRYPHSVFAGLLLVLAACAAPTPAIVPSSPTLTQTITPTATPSPRPTTDFKVQSDVIRPLLEQGPAAGETLVYGVVRFAGQPVIHFTDTPPNFWVRDEDEGNSVDTAVVYDPQYGEYLYRFRAGTYGISAVIKLGEIYPTPGDYTSFTQVKVADGQSTLNQDLALTRIMHLISPFDNTQPWDSGFARRKPWDTPLLDSSAVLIRWDAVPEASEYSLIITEVQFNPEKNVPWKNIQFHFDNRITATQLEIELPSSPEDHFYSVRLNALDTAGVSVGSLMIRLERGGFGWDVRFRVP